MTHSSSPWSCCILLFFFFFLPKAVRNKSIVKLCVCVCVSDRELERICVPRAHKYARNKKNSSRVFVYSFKVGFFLCLSNSLIFMDVSGMDFLILSQHEQ